MEKNIEPSKWRDGIDPFELPLRNVKILEILGYPHAANQVFYVKGIQDGKENYYYLKYAHHVDANFQNEVNILSQLNSPLLPNVVEYDSVNFQYELLQQIDGKRLSVILANSGMENGLAYMYEYGRTLANLHLSKGCFDDAPHRRFYDIPDKSYFIDMEIEDVHDWLVANLPTVENKCFVHGDFHYANILWRDNHISGILDFELAGIGNKEFDIARALILRPGQKFLKSESEMQEFLCGYTSVSNCEYGLILYYMVLIYTRLTIKSQVQKWECGKVFRRPKDGITSRASLAALCEKIIEVVKLLCGTAARTSPWHRLA